MRTWGAKPVPQPDRSAGGSIDLTPILAQPHGEESSRIFMTLGTTGRHGDHGSDWETIELRIGICARVKF